MVRLKCFCGVAKLSIKLRIFGDAAVVPSILYSRRKCVEWKFKVSISRLFWCAAASAASRKFQRNCYFWFYIGVSACQFSLFGLCVVEFWSEYDTVWLRIDIVYFAFCVRCERMPWAICINQFINMKHWRAHKMWRSAESLLFETIKVHCTCAHSFSSGLFHQIQNSHELQCGEMNAFASMVQFAKTFEKNSD